VNTVKTITGQMTEMSQRKKKEWALMACISFFHIERHSLFKYKHLYAAGGDIAAKEMSMCVAVTKKRL